MIKKKVLIATGGTGGHIFPAYSLIDILKKDYELILSTDRRGLNYLKNNKNLRVIKIPSSPLIKKNIYKFFLSVLTIIYSIIKSTLILMFIRPKIIIGMGGYSSFPICFAASILRIKFVIYENNLILGKANKYLLPSAKKLFVSYKNLEGVSKKYNKKIVEIGNLIREEILSINTFKDTKENLNNINILVLGGSQAAKIFAEELPQIFKRLKNIGMPIKIYQQCQINQNAQLSLSYKEADIDCEIFNFTDNINKYYSKANLVITRSGASVLGELINVKVPFISIPLPSSADNHQFKNAEFYQKKGFGYLLEEKKMKNELYDLIRSFYQDKSRIKNILSKQRQYSDKDVFRNLKNQLEKILDEKN